MTALPQRRPQCPHTAAIAALTPVAPTRRGYTSNAPTRAGPIAYVPNAESFGTRRSQVQILSPRLPQVPSPGGLAQPGPTESVAPDSASATVGCSPRKGAAGTRRGPVQLHTTTPTLPVMRLFTPRNLAYIKLDGRRHYLGPWGSTAADDAYRAKVRQLLHVEHPPGLEIERRLPTGATLEVRTVRDLFVAYDDYAHSFYTKRGRPTHTAANVRRVRALVEESGLAGRALAAADPEWLVDVRTAIARRHHKVLTRGTLNEYVAIIVRAFQFAAEHGLADASTHAYLKSVRRLRRGRPPASNLKPMREGSEVQPVPPEWIRAVRPHLSRTIRIMLDVQLLTGMRPEEVCAIRPADLKPTKNARVMVYDVDPNWDKTEHLENATPRRVWVGPRALRLLGLSQPPTPADYYFSPARALAEFNAARAAARTVASYPSHDLVVRRARRRAAGVRPHRGGEMYTPSSYRRALERGCARAAIAQAGAGVRPADRVGSFTPYRLRHNCATELANREQIQIAQVMLGHKSIQTTARYVKPWEKHAVAAALKYG